MHSTVASLDLIVKLPLFLLEISPSSPFWLAYVSKLFMSPKPLILSHKPFIVLSNAVSLRLYEFTN